jgi:malate synthase
VRTVIRYRHGVLSGRGASLLDGYMEDLATDRIYRLMIAQRMRHRDAVRVLDENGQPVQHTAELITGLFDEELKRIIGEIAAKVPPEDFRAQVELYTQARVLSEDLILHGEFNPS